MSGPEPGLYFIQLVEEPEPLIGVNLSPAPVAPVVTDGREKIWNVKKTENGLYDLTIQEGGRILYIQGEGDRLVGSDDPPPGVWSILGPEGGPYTIQVPNRLLPPTVWTVKRPVEPESPVYLHILELQFPHKNQEWYFRPVLRE